jgi:hypothetical protein
MSGKSEAHAMALQGERVAGFILITGIDGTRYAVRQHAASVIHDADEGHDETMVHLHGGVIVRVPCSLDESAGVVRITTGMVSLYAARASRASDIVSQAYEILQKWGILARNLDGVEP